MSVETPPDLIGEYLAKRGRRGGGQMPATYARRLADGDAAPLPPRPKTRRTPMSPRNYEPRHQQSGGKYLPIGPFRAWLQAMRDEHGKQWLDEVVQGATNCTLDVAERKIYRWLSESQSVHIDIVDKVALFTTGPDLLRELYPLDEDSLSDGSAHPSESGA